MVNIGEKETVETVESEQANEDVKKHRLGARRRAFMQIEELLDLHRATWEADVNDEVSTTEARHDAEVIVEFIDHLYEQVSELETAPAGERLAREKSIAGPVEKRKYYVVQKGEELSWVHVANPHVYVGHGVRLFGPLNTQVGAEYRISNGLDDLPEVDLYEG